VNGYLDRKREDPEWRRGEEGFLDFMREQDAGATIALRWVRSLRPDFPVDMMDEATDPGDPPEWGTLYRYDPATGEWADLTGEDEDDT
jgi:hypothetical protein